MIDIKRLDQIKRRAEQGDPVVGVGDTITNRELLELIRAYRISCKELEVIYELHEIDALTENVNVTTIAEQLVDKADALAARGTT